MSKCFCITAGDQLLERCLWEELSAGTHQQIASDRELWSSTWFLYKWEVSIYTLVINLKFNCLKQLYQMASCHQPTSVTSFRKHTTWKEKRLGHSPDICTSSWWSGLVLLYGMVDLLYWVLIKGLFTRIFFSSFFAHVVHCEKPFVFVPPGRWTKAALSLVRLD